LGDIDVDISGVYTLDGDQRMNAKVLISVPRDKLARIDRLARRNGKSRSAFIVGAALAAEAPARYARPIDDPAVRDAVRVIEEGRKSWKGSTDVVRLIRRMRDSRY
jgi:hypothetical protein